MTLDINHLELQGKNIVIVEDDIPSIRYYESLLRHSGASLRIFHNGKEFVDFLKTEKPVIDLLFIDFLIPLINGIDCIKVFRSGQRNAPVIMITAYSSEQAKTDAFIAGCNEYVLKPIYPEKICYLISKYLTDNTEVPYSLFS
jgi:CheY-like chemotaxis protein